MSELEREFAGLERVLRLWPDRDGHAVGGCLFVMEALGEMQPPEARRIAELIHLSFLHELDEPDLGEIGRIVFNVIRDAALYEAKRKHYI
jgi:hypothetical protein